MAKADGSVIIDTKMDTSGVKKGTEEAKEFFEEFGEQTEKAGKQAEGTSQQASDLASTFKNLGKAIIAAGVIDAIVDFGKEAIELGSDLEEVQNVVDVTFETMSDKVNQFAKDAQKSAGLSEKMAKQYVGTFGAMADSFGFTEQEAYEMSTALTQLTGDVASFYNLSQDEAATKLKGVFTGETEALKELGVVMTQTALDSYAMANGFGKTTSAMSEQEKVALRYQFVMDQLSAASGDFVRTQDSWANQSKILALQWESLMATIGSGLIETLSPSVKVLNDEVLPALQEAAEWVVELMTPPPSKKLEKSLKDVASSMEGIEDQYQSTSEAIDTTAAKAEIYRGMLMDLQETGLQTAESQAQYAHIVEQLNALYPDLNLRISEHTGLLTLDSQQLLQNLEIMKERALMAAIETQYTDILSAQATATMSVTEAQTSLMDVQAERTLIEQQLTESTGLTIEQLYELDVAQRTGKETTQKLTAEQQALLIQLTLIKGEEVALNNTITEGEAVISEYDSKLKELRETYGLTEPAIEGVADGQADVAATAQSATDSVKELQQSYLDAKKSARDSIDSQIGLFSDLKAESELSADTIVENWKSQQAGFDQYKQDLEKAVELGLDETLVKQLADGSEESMAILHNLVTDTDLNIDEFNAQFQKTEEARNTVSEMMASVQSDLVGKFTSMSASVSRAWNEMDGETQSAINDIQSAINSLYGKTIYIDTIHRTFYENYGNPDSSSIVTSGDVPFLAKGAVIPPNAPFMAVLGDQRRGTNVEAPLSTIQEAVESVISNGMMAGFEALLKENRMLRETVENIQVGDDVLGRAVNRYNRHMNVITGGEG